MDLLTFRESPIVVDVLGDVAVENGSAEEGNWP